MWRWRSRKGNQLSCEQGVNFVRCEGQRVRLPGGQAGRCHREQCARVLRQIRAPRKGQRPRHWPTGTACPGVRRCRCCASRGVASDGRVRRPRERWGSQGHENRRVQSLWIAMVHLRSLPLRGKRCKHRECSMLQGNWCSWGRKCVGHGCAKNICVCRGGH